MATICDALLLACSNVSDDYEVYHTASKVDREECSENGFGILRTGSRGNDILNNRKPANRKLPRIDFS